MNTLTNVCEHFDNVYEIRQKVCKINDVLNTSSAVGDADQDYEFYFDTI